MFSLLLNLFSTTANCHWLPGTCQSELGCDHSACHQHHNGKHPIIFAASSIYQGCWCLDWDVRFLCLLLLARVCFCKLCCEVNISYKKICTIFYRSKLQLHTLTKFTHFFTSILLLGYCFKFFHLIGYEGLKQLNRSICKWMQM